MKLKLIMLASVFAFGLAFNASAGNVTDADSDSVPDTFDNCPAVANGPNQGSNQVDTDLDGYGNACDADYSTAGTGNDGVVNTTDFGPFLTAFNAGTGDEQDHDGNGVVNTTDFGTFLTQFNAGVPGPGLACAGTIPCLP